MRRRGPEWVFPVAALLIILLSSVVKAQTTLATGTATGNSPGGLTGYISACQGTASVSPAIESFHVSGSNLTANVTVTAPVNFEVSLDPNTGYSNNVNITQSGGNVNNVPVYVRSAAAAPAGKLYGDVILSSPGAADDDVPVTGIIYTVPTVSAQPVSQELATGAFTTPLNFTGAGNTYTWTNDMPSIGLPATGSGNIPSFPAINNSNSKITATITVTSQQIPYAYITNRQDNTVSVINVITNAIVATIPVGKDPVGVAVGPDGTKVYITNQRDNTISVISSLTNKVISTIQLKDSSPTGIAVSPDGKEIFVVNLNSNSVSVIDAASENVIYTYAVGGYPVGVTVSPDGSDVFVTNSSDNISVINLMKNNVTTINATKGPYDVCTSSDGSLLYVTNLGSNTVSVINLSTLNVIATIPVGTAPQGIAITPDGSTLYVTNSTSGNVSVISTATNRVTATINVGSAPIGVSVTSDGRFVYVANQSSNSVSVINTSSNNVSATIPVGSLPESLGNFITPGSECPGIPAKFTITVDPAALAPAIIAGNATGNIIACQGSASAAPDISQFIVSGRNLSEGIAITAPVNFEVSLNATVGYSSGLVIGQSSGAVPNATVYVRSAVNAPAGNISGNITLTSNGAITQNVPVSGVVNALPSVNQVPNQVITNGSSTAAINFTGNTNVFDWTNDTPSIGLPASGVGDIPAFTAINNTTIPVTAKIMVVPMPPASGNGNTPKCEGTPVNFTITVEPLSQSIIIPNTFTPNGDGINDTWEIKSLENYPNCTVAIYNRWGEKLYSSVGYPVPWDGTYKGVNLPVGTYYYIINLGNGVNVISGWVAIVK